MWPRPSGAAEVSAPSIAKRAATAASSALSAVIRIARAEQVLELGSRGLRRIVGASRRAAEQRVERRLRIRNPAFVSGAVGARPRHEPAAEVGALLVAHFLGHGLATA